MGPLTAAVVVDRTAVWGLLAACSLLGAAALAPPELRRAYYARHACWRDAPLAFAGDALVAVLTGAGCGMAACGVLVAVAALAARF